jgi:hypothetical protein
VSGRSVKIARLKEEWFEDLEDPASAIQHLHGNRAGVDVFTFWQRLPNAEPRYSYRLEWDNVAALRITSYAEWWETQIGPKTRNLIRKAEKKGVHVRSVPFTDDLVKGIKTIFDETPIRQGKPFWHYKKAFETVKHEMSDRLDRAEFIGAYFDKELIGFIKLLYADKYADMVEILSKLEHRDKSPTNALLAKAVEICSERKLPYLVYAHWAHGSLGDFKRNNGFQKIDLPRYYIPLTLKGRIFLGLNLHHGVRGLLPLTLKAKLIELRKRWYTKISTEKHQTDNS